MDKAGKSVGSTFLQMTNPSLSQRAALAVQGHRGQIKKLKTAYDATGRSDKKLRAQLEKTVHSMRKARSGARAYGKSLAVAAGNSKKLTSASVINNGAWGPLGSAIGGRLVGGAAIVQSAALVVKNVIDAKTREDQALFRIGTVSGYDPGTDDRKAFQQGSLAKARAVADFRGFKIYELLDNQYALLYAGLEQSLALKGAETVAIVAKNTNSNPDEIANLIASAYKNFGTQFNGSAEDKLKQIADLLTKTHSQYKINDFTALGQNLKTAAATASTYKVPLKDMLAILGELSNSSLAEQSGAAFSAMLQQMGKEKTMEKLGYQLVRYDNQAINVIATLKKMADAYQKLKDSKGLTTATQVFAEVFGDEGVNGTTLWLERNNGMIAGLAALNTAIGTNEKQIKEFSATTAADINKLGDAFDNLKRALFFETGLISSAAGGVNAIADVFRHGWPNGDVKGARSQYTLNLLGSLQAIEEKANRKMANNKTQNINVGGIHINATTPTLLEEVRELIYGRPTMVLRQVEEATGPFLGDDGLSTGHDY
ncbi:phage tail tape measure protein [Candidatus Persebacteraceae bacterium Df01]|uniref:Phage tail tape measure protein n=1 Tax=Candidatus Doriopsillibacter californiensis TaxID=2970740 RepID=A0ABT7QMB4_9GAMM|nr:phage tail tape measure protein [Candidatus Persebacteraceae bacterium Df01]